MGVRAKPLTSSLGCVLNFKLSLLISCSVNSAELRFCVRVKLRLMRTEIFNERGFEIFDNAFDQQTADYLTLELARLDFGTAAKTRKAIAFGVRNLLNVATVIREFAASAAVSKLVEPIAGEKAQVVRAIFFDKTTGANWKVPFHQDLTIAVREQRDVGGFTAWTRKADILHVQPPDSVLENIVSLRVHLDETRDG